METFDLGSFSIDDEKPVTINTKKEHTVAMPKTKSLKNALMKVPQMPSATKTKLTKVPPEDAKQHQDYIIMISRYGTSPRFSDYLKSLTFKLDIQSLKKLNMIELEELLQRVKTSIANRAVSDVWSSTIFGAIGVTENVIGSTQLADHVKLKGLSEALKYDETFLDMIEELKLGSQNLAYVSLETRLLYTIISTTMRVHSLNTLMDKRKNRTRKKDKEPIAPTDVEQPVPKPPVKGPKDVIIDMSD
jgi:hypothetical protein